MLSKHKLTLPSLRFHLQEWQESDFNEFREFYAKIERLITNAGRSDAFKQRREELYKISKNNPRQLSSLIKAPIDVRVVTDLLQERNFLTYAFQAGNILDQLTYTTGRLSYISLLNLIRAFLLHFQYILANNQDFLIEMQQLIQDNLSRLQSRFMSSDLSKLARYRNIIFSIHGPTTIVKQILNEGRELIEEIEKLGLLGYDDTDYFNLCKYHYYIETLKSIPVDSEHQILDEVAKKEVYEAVAPNGGRLGHEILKILIERASYAAPPERWLNIILTIAGDPRVSPASSTYRNWWAFLDKKLIDKVTGWLSKVDLRLFLQILKDYGEEAGDLALKRMFPVRQRFLMALVEQGLVQYSRLFVSNQASRYLMSFYKPEELPSYAHVKDTYRSVIYLKVGDCHMVEGSHNFSLRIFSKLAESSKRILDPSVKMFQPCHLSTSLVTQYQNEFDDHDFIEIRHSSTSALSWQAKAVEFFCTHGVKLDLEKMFSHEDYIFYKDHYGLPFGC